MCFPGTRRLPASPSRPTCAFARHRPRRLRPAAVSDSSGTPAAAPNHNETAGITQYLYARHGWFKRDIIKATVGSYSKPRVAPTAYSAPTCTYAEEINTTRAGTPTTARACR